MGEMAARRLIVNADDFGLTGGVSRGILRAHREGLVTSTTVLASLPLQPELDAEAAALSRLGLGLHFNLTWERPVSPPGTVPSLVDGEGRFGRDLTALGARARPDEVRRECEAQIELFTRRFGRGPTHLDSHHHVGQREPILDLVLDFARAIKVPVRSQDERVREAARRAKLKTPDRMVGESGPDPCWTAERVLREVTALPPGVTEFMTHPGRFDDDLAYSRYGRQREVELAGLTDQRARALIEREGIRLAHFGDL